MPVMLTEDLTDSIKRRTLAPISQQTFQDSDLIELANEEMEIDLIPEIISVRNDFFKVSTTINLTVGLARYRIPQRAAYGSLVDVFFIYTNGKRFTIPVMPLDKLPTLDMSVTRNIPLGFSLESDELVIWPAPNVTGQIEIWFYSRRNQLVPTADCAKITSISTVSGTTTFTVNTDLSAALSVGSKIDIISTKSPFQNWAESVAITAITTTTIAMLSTDIDDAVGTVLPTVGDYICAEMTSCIPQVPQEFHAVLAQMVAARLMEGLGDLQKLEAVNGKLAAMKKQALGMIQQRIENKPDPIVIRNGLMDGLLGRRYTR